MKKFRFSIIAAMALFAGISITSCTDAGDYNDSNTDNPSWVDKYTDSLVIAHPETLAGTTWTRGTGLKKNAYGEEIQGFIESLNFVKEDSVAVKMSEGATAGTWKDESNTEKTPYYEYKYSNVTGTVEIMKESKNEKGAVTKTTIFTGVAVNGKQQVMTVVHYGDIPVQTYLVQQ